MRLRMLDQSRADPGGADLRIDHQRPQQSMPAEQLQADESDSATLSHRP